jgi:hypothetical protein
MNKDKLRFLKLCLELSVLLLFIGLRAAAQEKIILISGYASDAGTGERLTGVLLRVGAQVTVTNSYGFYSLRTPAGEQTLAASCIGYVPFNQSMLLTSDTVVSVALESGIALDEITVLADNRIETKGIGAMRVNISQLSVSPLFFGERDIIKTMQFLPGVSSGMEGSSNLNIRGGANDQTLYLMDDVPVYNQNHTFGLISIFNPDAILNADIYKGGIPSVYGNRLSGVASIGLKDGNMKTHRQSISLGVLSGTLSAEGPIVNEKASYLFTARRSFLDLLLKGFYMLASDGGYGMPVVSFWDVNGKVTWNISPSTKLSASLYSGNDNAGGMNAEKDKNSNYVDKFGLGWRTSTASLRILSNIDARRFLSSSLYFLQLENYQYHNIRTDEYRYDGRKISRIQEAGWRTRLENRLSNRHTLSAGYDVSIQLFKPEVFRQNKRITEWERIGLNTFSGFVDDELKLGNFTLQTGLRASWYHTDRKNAFALEPRIKMSVSLNDNNRLMAAFDRMTQPVHSTNEMVYAVRTDYWTPYGESRPPSAIQLSAGWKNYAIPHLSVTVETYYKQLYHLVNIQDLESYLDYHTGYQTGTGRSAGVEIMTQYSRGRLSSWFACTFSKSTRTFAGRTVPFKYDTPHDLSLFAAYDVHKRAQRKNSLSVNMQYRTGLPYYVSEISYPGLISAETANPWYYKPDIDYIPQYPNTRIRDFFRLDFNFTMEQPMKKGRRIWQFSLLNATGRENPYNVYLLNGQYRAFLLIQFMPSISFRREF